MRRLTFDPRQPAHGHAFKWIYVAFNARAEQRTTEQVRRNLELLEKFHAVSVPDETARWEFVEEARALTPGTKRIDLTDAEFATLERTIEEVEQMVQPVAVLKHVRPAAELLRSATRERAQAPESTRRGKA